LVLALLGVFVSVTPASAEQVPGYVYNGRIVQSAWGFSYAPSIVYENGTYYMFWCSSGSGGPDNWDQIRFSASTDGVNWMTPAAPASLTATGGGTENSMCDPSIVKYQAAGDSQPYYYLYYTGCKEGVGGVVFVARSTSLTGEWAKYTTNNTWMVRAPNPKPLISPKVNHSCDNPKTIFYGAGQQSVVAVGTQLYMWFGDDTQQINPTTHLAETCGSPCKQMWLATSGTATAPGSATSWSAPTRVITNDPNIGSADVKWEPTARRFEMYQASPNHSANAQLVRRTSSDGRTWTSPSAQGAVLCDAACFSNGANNVGVSGTATGSIIADKTLVVYGSVCDKNPSCYDHYWDSTPIPAWDLHESTLTNNPVGAFDSITRYPGGATPKVRVQGWAIDPNTFSAINADAYVGPGTRMTANTTRTDVGGIYTAYGNLHGFNSVVNAASGSQTACVYGINVGAGTTNPQLGCKPFVVDVNPWGSLDSATSPSAGTILITGWTIDPDQATAITYDVYVDGVRRGNYVANTSRPDVGNAHPDYGNSHGYSLPISATRGLHTVCTYGINTYSGTSNTTLGCRSVTAL